MELKNQVLIDVKVKDVIENTHNTIYHGLANFDGNSLSFQINDDSYCFSKVGSHYMTLEHDGEMSYSLDLKPNTSFDTTLTVASYDVPIECKCKNLSLFNECWTIEYQIFQMDSLLFHSLITIQFEH